MENCNEKVNASLKAFTLIELLIVIGIVAILASLLVPALNSARRHGQTVVCTSNLRQIGVAAMMYANDHDECLPAAYGYMGWSAGGGSAYVETDRDIQFVLASYLGGTNSMDSKVWVCPLAAKYGFPNGALFKFGAPAAWGYKHDCTYHWNGARTTGSLSDSAPDTSDINTPIHMMTQASKAALMWDVPDSDPAAHEEDKVNCLFLDGHVGMTRLGSAAATDPDTLWWYTSSDPGKGWDGWTDR